MTATDQVLKASSAYLYFWSWSTFIAILFKRILHIGYESVIWEEHKSLFLFSPSTFDLFQLICTIQQTNRQTDRSGWVKIIIYYYNLKLAFDIIFYVVLLIITLVFFMKGRRYIIYHYYFFILLLLVIIFHFTHIFLSCFISYFFLIFSLVTR